MNFLPFLFPFNSSGFQGQQPVQLVQEVPPGCQVPEHAFHLCQAGSRGCVFYHVDCLCEVLVAVSQLCSGRGKAGSLAGVCVQDTVHGGCALESTQDCHLYGSVLKLLGDTWLLHLLMKPNNRCKGFSSEAVCTRVLQGLASLSSDPPP